MSRYRKILTSCRLVHSIDSALDPHNYDEITHLNKDGCWETFVGYLGPKSNKAIEKIFWSSDVLSCFGRQRQCDIIPDGKHWVLLGRAKHIETIKDAFDLLFDEEIFFLIESKTNEKIRKRTETLTNLKEHLFESSRYPWIKPKNIFELRALIGLLYFRGLFGMNHHSLNILFSDKARPPVFSATMSRDRMKFLLSTLAFDDPEARKEKWPYGRFAAARPIFEMFNSNTSKYLLPSLYLSIDEPPDSYEAPDNFPTIYSFKTTQIQVVIEITKWRFISLYVQSLSLCWETRKRGRIILHRLYWKLCSLSCQSNCKSCWTTRSKHFHGSFVHKHIVS